MDLSEVNNGLENLDLADDEKKAILQLIDLKINNDMKEFFAAVRHLENKIEMNQQVLGEKIDMVHDKLSSENKVGYWVIGIVVILMTFVFTMVAKK